MFTLDTGLLFPETLALKARLEDFFGLKIESLEPDLTLEEQADINGPELWARNPDLCCTIRKVLPLRDKLCDLDCWITGLRRQQSETRAGMGIIELYAFDEESGRDIVKLNPMAKWTREAVWNYIREQQDSLQSPARWGLSLDRLPALHAQDRQWRRRTRWPLDGVQQSGMRHPHVHAQETGFPDLSSAAGSANITTL